jgi:copper(I)-binding protein
MFEENPMKKTIQSLATAVALGTLCTPLWAQSVDVSNAWARATVQGQTATGAS